MLARITPTGAEITDIAWRDFDMWCDSHRAEIEDLDAAEIAVMYTDDEVWWDSHAALDAEYGRLVHNLSLN